MTNPKTWVIVNDIQIPFQDHRALGLVLNFIESLKPHGVILNGDIVDSYELSEFAKNPLSKASLKMEITQSQKLMDRLSKMTKERHWIGGNHEDRLRRYIWRNAPALGCVDEVAFPALFGLQHFGFSWQGYGGVHQLGKLRVTHGSMVSKHSGQSAKAHYEKYGVSILIGHTHRLGAFYKRDMSNTTAVAFENGCLCTLTPEYDSYPNWQQGFSVVHVEENGFFHVQQIPILRQGGKPMFFYGRDKVTS